MIHACGFNFFFFLDDRRRCLRFGKQHCKSGFKQNNIT